MGDTHWGAYRDGVGESQAAPDADGSPRNAQAQEDAECNAVAKQRAADAATYGYDVETQKAIFDRCPL
jgi:hypothetical protein